MLDFGTKVVAGVTPGKGGQKVEGVPVYDGADEAVRRKKANASIIFVPAAYAKDAVIEAVEAGIQLIAVITEHIPFHDALEFQPYARSKGVTVMARTVRGLRRPARRRWASCRIASSDLEMSASSRGAEPSRTRS